MKMSGQNSKLHFCGTTTSRVRSLLPGWVSALFLACAALIWAAPAALAQSDYDDNPLTLNCYAVVTNDTVSINYITGCDVESQSNAAQLCSWYSPTTVVTTGEDPYLTATVDATTTASNYVYAIMWDPLPPQWVGGNGLASSTANMNVWLFLGQLTSGVDQQTSPVHDKIFAIDIPGPYTQVGSDDYGSTACADNFTNYIYIGSTVVSDVGLWCNLTQVVLQSLDGTGLLSLGIVTSGNKTLPTTWGGWWQH
jgi:hypothetical protein